MAPDDTDARARNGPLMFLEAAQGHATPDHHVADTLR